MKRSVLLLLVPAFFWACTPGPGSGGPDLEYAIAIHGGAGSVTSSSMDEESRKSYEEGLRGALELGRSMLDDGGAALDVVEKVIMHLEDHPAFNAGKGAVLNEAGGFELDASIMDGQTKSCGAVGGVATVKNPIVLARKVMEQTPHVLLCTEGAERFADRAGVERVPREYFRTEKRIRQWREKMEESKQEAEHGTVGVVALDRSGNLAAGTSTGGLTGKMFGRIGDTPIVGAGTYADNGTCAVSCTGKGEEFIRNAVAYSVSAMMEHGGLDLQAAAEAAIHGRLEEKTGGLIAVDGNGKVAMVFNSEGMLRGAADSSGRFEVVVGN